MKKWIIAKVVLLLCLAAAAARPTPGISDSEAPVFVYLLMAAIACGIYVAITPLVLRLFPSTMQHLGSSLWRLRPIVPLSFAHLLAWLAIAFSTGLLVQCFMGQPFTDDILVPLAASVGSGIGILTGISVLRRRIGKANKALQAIGAKARLQPER